MNLGDSGGMRAREGVEVVKRWQRLRKVHCARTEQGTSMSLGGMAAAVLLLRR